MRLFGFTVNKPTRGLVHVFAVRIELQLLYLQHSLPNQELYLKDYSVNVLMSQFSVIVIGRRTTRI